MGCSELAGSSVVVGGGGRVESRPLRGVFRAACFTMG